MIRVAAATVSVSLFGLIHDLHRYLFPVEDNIWVSVGNIWGSIRYDSLQFIKFSLPGVEALHFAFYSHCIMEISVRSCGQWYFYKLTMEMGQQPPSRFVLVHGNFDHPANHIASQSRTSFRISADLLVVDQLQQYIPGSAMCGNISLNIRCLYYE